MAQGLAGAVIPPEVLGQIPGCEDGRAPLQVRPLPGGRGRNRVLRVDTGAGRFVWRQRYVPVDRPGSAARTELRAQQLAGPAGFAPRLLAAHPGGEWLLMEFIDAPMWTAAQLDDREQVARLGARLAQLHAIAVPDDLPSMDATAIATGHQARLGAVDPVAARAVSAMVARIDALGHELSASADCRALNHGDLVMSNLLGPLPRFVDWEYAQVTDPTYDLACLVAYYPQLDRHLDRLMGSAGLDSGADRARLGLQRERFALVNHLWEQVPRPDAG